MYIMFSISWRIIFYFFTEQYNWSYNYTRTAEFKLNLHAAVTLSNQIGLRTLGCFQCFVERFFISYNSFVGGCRPTSQAILSCSFVHK